MNRTEIIVKFLIQLVFKAIVGVVVYFIALHLLGMLDWRVVVAAFVAGSTAANAKVTFREPTKVPLEDVVKVKTPEDQREEQAIAIRQAYRDGHIDKIQAVKDIRNLFNHTSDSRGFLKEAKAYVEGDL